MDRYLFGDAEHDASLYCAMADGELVEVLQQTSDRLRHLAKLKLFDVAGAGERLQARMVALQSELTSRGVQVQELTQDELDEETLLDSAVEDFHASERRAAGLDEPELSAAVATAAPAVPSASDKAAQSSSPPPPPGLWPLAASPSSSPSSGLREAMRAEEAAQRRSKAAAKKPRMPRWRGSSKQGEQLVIGKPTVWRAVPTPSGAGAAPELRAIQAQQQQRESGDDVVFRTPPQWLAGAGSPDKRWGSPPHASENMRAILAEQEARQQMVDNDALLAMALQEQLDQEARLERQRANAEAANAARKKTNKAKKGNRGRGRGRGGGRGGGGRGKKRK